MQNKFWALAMAGAIAAVSAAATPLPARADINVSGMGNYCSLTWPGGGWSFASMPDGGDPCGWLIAQSQPGYTIQRKGLYSPNGLNNVVVRCNATGSWVGIYRGIGNGPLTAAFNSANKEKQTSCIFTVAPAALPVFTSPFSLGAAYSHGTGFDFARGTIATLDVSQFGQPGSHAANTVDWKGRDRTGYINDHAGHDWGMPQGTPIRAVADGVVISARDWAMPKPCFANNPSKVQKEVSIRHVVRGSKGYYEQFVTYYAHLSSYQVAEGQKVVQGQLLGLSGMTGCASAPHLHFGTLRETNTANNRFETLHFYPWPQHSDGNSFVVDAWSFDAPKGFDPWAYRAYPAGALSITLWKNGQAPSVGTW
jgi:Peptidase family M23